MQLRSGSRPSNNICDLIRYNCIPYRTVQPTLIKRKKQLSSFIVYFSFSTIDTDNIPRVCIDLNKNQSMSTKRNKYQKAKNTRTNCHKLIHCIRQVQITMQVVQDIQIRCHRRWSDTTNRTDFMSVEPKEQNLKDLHSENALPPSGALRLLSQPRSLISTQIFNAKHTKAYTVRNYHTFHPVAFHMCILTSTTNKMTG